MTEPRTAATDRCRGTDPGESTEPEERTGESTTCTECGSSRVTTDSVRGERVCDACGAVLDDRVLDRGPEWRAFSHEEKQNKSRVGTPTSLAVHDRGLTTAIDWRNKDAHGKTLAADKQTKMKRLRRWQERIRTRDAGERNLQFALGEIDRMSSSLGVSRSVREMAAVVYRRALDEDLIRGRSIEGVATSALYAACKKDGTPRSLERITDVSRVERREIGRTYRYIVQELGLEIAPTDPQAYVPRFVSALDLGESTKRTAMEVLAETTERGLHSGKSPTGFAAAAVYLAAILRGEKRTQRAVADVAQVTEVTIRNRYQEQYEVLSDESVSLDGVDGELPESLFP